MSVFKEAENTSAYLKAGILGFAGSGKSFTAAKIAIGLHKYTKSNAPVFFIDTETGSSFLVPMFEKEKIPFMVSHSRAFVTLLDAVDEAEKANGILIIDSISHFWLELMNSFKKRKNIDRLYFQHWGPIKEEWGQFTTKYVNSKCHIIMNGRAGWEYDYETDSEGNKELTKTGTKMKAEVETGYEPSLLIEMEKVRSTEGKIGGAFLHRAWVIKDRFDQINGHKFDDPDFEAFLPHISRLNLGGSHVGVDTSVDSTQLFNTDRSVSERFKQRDIMIEELGAEMDLRFNTRTDEGKKQRIEWLKATYGTSSKTAIENLQNEVLKVGLDALKAMPVMNAPPAPEPEEKKTKKEKK